MPPPMPSSTPCALHPTRLRAVLPRRSRSGRRRRGTECGSARRPAQPLRHGESIIACRSRVSLGLPGQLERVENLCTRCARPSQTQPSCSDPQWHDDRPPNCGYTPERHDATLLITDIVGFVMSRSSVRVRQAAPQVRAIKVALASIGARSEPLPYVPLGAALGRREPLPVSHACPKRGRPSGQPCAFLGALGSAREEARLVSETPLPDMCQRAMHEALRDTQFFSIIFLFSK
jgi:hypothetical protein